MNTLTIHPADEHQEKALKAFLEALKVEYDEQEETDETERILANPEFVEKLEEGRKDMQEGKGQKINPPDL
jgi:hypothetical protein